MMQLSVRKPLLSLLLILAIFCFSPSANVHPTDMRDSNIKANFDSDPVLNFHPSSGPTKTGILPAIEFLQSGTNTETTGLLSARTDETPSVVSNLTLDTVNGWRSDQIELNISEVRKLLALNGTFGNGYPGVNVEPSGSVSYYPLGWDADSFNDEPGKQTLSAAYNDTGRKFIELELEGEDDGYPDYKVFKNSEIYWYQDITRSPAETDFLLSFDLLYDSGPIGTRHLNDFQLRIEAGSTTLWSTDPVTIPARDIWNHIGPIPVSLASVPTSFELRFVFEIIESRTLEGDRADFDGDVNNARFLRFYVDDISLVSADYYDPDDANMRVDVAPVGLTSISGSNGNGQALVSHSFWDTSPLSLSILSDEPVSFNYEARFVHELRTGNTSTTTSPTEVGVDYSVDTDESPVLTSYFYVPAHDNLEDFIVELPHSSDYENATVYDASLTDVTSFCTLSENTIAISGNILDSLGWWKVIWESPNYARKVTPQQFVMPSWENQTQFNADDKIRTLVEIGTVEPLPALIENLMVSWFLPNDTLWFEETINDGVDGIAFTIGLTLEAHNATPGQWSILVFWNNGTEIAYGETSFDLYHNSSLLPVNAFIEAEPDSSATCAVYLRDADTNEFLLNELSTVVGNWSTGTITFQRNLAQSWWEGELNTSMMGFGNYTVVINATSSYYSFSTCSVIVEIATVADLAYFGPSYVEVGLGSSYNAKFRYSYSDGTGIEDALIEVISIVGPPSGLSYGSTVATPGEPGNYSIDFQVDLGGTYLVVISASKAGHNTETVSFNIISAAFGTDLILLNGTSDVMNVGETYILALQYLNETGEVLDGASVSVVDVVPSSGLTFDPTQPQGNGTYTILVNSNLAGIYSITFRASLDGYDSQIRLFTLVVSSKPSIFSLDSSLASISADSDYTLNITFTDLSFQGLENASIAVVSVSPATGLWISETSDLGLGLYSITLDPLEKGTYNLVLRGTLENYQNSTALFTLVVTDVPTSIQTSDGLVSGFCYFTESLEITLLYERTDNDTLVTGALIEISAVVSLDYVVVETPIGYNITINPTSLGHWSLLITASRPQYQNTSMTFDFEVREAETGLFGVGPPTNIYFGIHYSFTLTYLLNVSNGIDNATIIQTYRGVQGNPFSWMDYHNGTYGFSFTAGDPGSYVASIEFSKYGYESAEVAFSFTIFEVPTVVTAAALPESLYGTRVYEIGIYVTTSGYDPVEDAEVTYSNSLISFIISETFVNGWYNISFSPETGNFSAAEIHIKKHGYGEAVVEFPLLVDAIPITISSEYALDSTYSRIQGSNLSLSLRLAAGDTREELSDADASYLILETGENGVFEIETDGTYTAIVQVPRQAGTYTLRVSATKQQFRELSINIILISELDETALVRRVIFTGFEISAFLLGSLAVVYAGRRRQKRINMRKQMELVNLRARFSDANNIIGFLVIQRTTGLPIYSRILKGGFEMSIISGFISAISNFAMEIRTEEKLWTPIPISEVVTAVQTKELICALLTVDAPSPALIKSLEEISLLIGSRFDSYPDILSMLSQHMSTKLEYKGEFDKFFAAQFDFNLLVSYSSYDLARKGEFPLIELAIISGDMNRPFYVSELVRYLLTSGVEETKAYSMVIEATKSGFLLSLDKSSKDES